MVARAAPSSRPPDVIASALSEATFARILAPATGDAVAAAAILDSTLDCPTQIRPLAPADEPAAIAAVGDETDTTILLDDAVTAPETAADAIDVRLSGRGSTGAAADTPEEPTGEAAHKRPLSIAARAVARRLGADPAPLLVLVGAVAAGVTPTTVAPDLVDRATDDGTLERRPGVATPTSDLADGLAHSTLLAGSFSGDAEAARATLESVELDTEDETDGRRLASAVVCSILEDEVTPVRAATAVERAIRPLATPDGPFDTVGGFADVLEATARSDAGLAITMALRMAGSTGPAGDATAVDGDTADAALSAWREFASVVHAVEAPAADDALATTRTDLAATHLPPVARLLRDFRVEADAVAVTGDAALAIAGAPARTSEFAAAVTEVAQSQAVLRVTTPTPGVVLVTPLEDDPASMLEAVRAVIDG